MIKFKLLLFNYFTYKYHPITIEVNIQNNFKKTILIVCMLSKIKNQYFTTYKVNT